jgi:gas vesicle protein
MEENNGFGYFLLGLGLGVAAGVLLAPKSGAETRDLLLSKANEGTDYLKARADEGKEYLRQRTSELRDSASDVVEKGRSTVTKHRDTLTAAVEAGKQAYRDAVTSFEDTAKNEGAPSI